MTTGAVAMLRSFLDKYVSGLLIDSHGKEKNMYNDDFTKCMEIIKRGGFCTKEELDVLLKTMPCYDYEYEQDVATTYDLIYLPEVKGYCCIGENLYKLDASLYGEGIFKDEKIYCEWAGIPLPFQMIFCNNKFTKYFNSYDELRRDFYTQKREPDAIDPRNNPEFNRIFQCGCMNLESEYDIFLSYMSYWKLSREKSVAVIDLGNNEYCEMEIEFNVDENKVSKPLSVVPTYKNGFAYKKIRI